MRAHDPAIGLAVAWARRRGVRFRVHFRKSYERCVVYVETAYYQEMWNGISLHRHTDIVDRGPVVESMPHTDTRVAFGIATRRIWLRVPTSGREMYAFAGALLMATEARAQSIREAGARARRRSP